MISKSVEETFKIAKDFIGRILHKKDTRENAKIVALSGDLGAGKTAFTKAVAEILGIKEKVNSPTFVIMKRYPINLEGYKFFFHIDAYRLKDEKELLLLGWDEIINNKEHLVFIEWPENVKNIIPKDSRFIEIEHLGEEERNFNLK
ncbi:tRNA (adenosine(37)-N6)-threonylcarbamoyltransferase complex ATPase subunit type 1 TsaE [Candidatus Nomurabacteria bacterium]|nr:tRNA (adenosine(37)-N6)-threonylcarbamoyltransferase complex ATPase subunit type 1 TsaE [Candidatus Nomurabacteria bacterium]